MITIKNQLYTAIINEIGAELTHFAKVGGQEVIWQSPAGKYWQRHAPILFPAIGRSNKDEYRIGEKTFKMGQHGFARDFAFNIVKQDEDAVVLRLSANDETEQYYPFDFELTVTYWLTQTGMEITYNVKNSGSTLMPYALGFHPGFNLPEPIENLELVLEGKTTPVAVYGIEPAPFRDGTLRPLAVAQRNVVPLSYALLDKGLVILDAADAERAVLQNHSGKAYLSLRLGDFSNVTLWSPEGQQAPFLCIEPFAGLPDEFGVVSDWQQKLGNQLLPGGEAQTLTTEIQC